MTLSTPILTGRASKIVRWLLWGSAALIVGFIIWSAFFKRTNTQHTTVENGGEANYYWQGAEVSIGAFSCVSLPAEKYRKEKK